MGQNGRPRNLSVVPTLLRTGPYIGKWRRGREIWLMVLSEDETEYVVQKSQFIGHLLEHQVSIWHDSAGREHVDNFLAPKLTVCLADFEGDVMVMSVERIFDDPETAAAEAASWNAFLATMPGYSVARAQPHHRPGLNRTWNEEGRSEFPASAG